MRFVTPCLLLLASLPIACSDDQAPIAPVEAAPVLTSEVMPNTLETLISDMDAAHEGFPRGVLTSGGEAWAWVYQPRVGYGNELPEGWNATVPWGQIYADTSGRTTEGTRFQLRNLRQYMLSKSDSTWRMIVAADDEIAGANYAEDFQDDANVPAGIRPPPMSAVAATASPLPSGTATISTSSPVIAPRLTPPTWLGCGRCSRPASPPARTPAPTSPP